jgi:hypothetical protein
MPPEEAIVRLRLTKRKWPKENTRSTQLADPSTSAVVNAVIAAAQVSKFYRDHIAKARAARRTIYIMERDVIQLLGQMKNHRLYICEQVGTGEAAIHAASMIWDIVLPVPTASGEFRCERFLEFGTQVSELPGFNLQWTLTAVGLLEELLLDPTGVTFAATYGDSDRAPLNFLAR